jgi:PKD repeat protein
MRRILLLFVVTSVYSAALRAQCPGCITNLPPLPADTIYLSPAPDGEVGVYYEQDISFRLPKTTTPVSAVDPTVPPGLTISQITITSVAFLPPGIFWEASQLVFNPAVETDGCVRLCGIPLQTDTFFVEVMITATIFGISQSSGFAFPVYIAPASSSTEGFSMSNNIGCGSTTVSFENNIPSGGIPGISYLWDFGNGNQSILENPPPQIYTAPGVYPVTYTATIDTSGYFLTNVTVLATDCSDFSFPPFNLPDLYIVIKNPNGTTIYTSPVIDNTTTPVNFNVFLELGPGNYQLIVYDEDFLVADELCGSVNFTQTTTGVLNDGALQVSLNIFHPVTEIISVDTVSVFPIPALPLIDPAGSPFLCAGSSLPLSASYNHNLQWFRNGELLAGETSQVLVVQQAGSYTVQYTSADGCSVLSNPTLVTLQASPPTPVFANSNNLLSISDPGALPGSYSLQWLQNGAPITGATGLSYCITEFGTYTLVLTDESTGCSSSFSSTVAHNPNVDCTTSVASVLRSDRVRLFPNPARDRVWLELSADIPEVILSVRDLHGRAVLSPQRLAGGGGAHELELPQLPAGMYLVILQTATELHTEKLYLQPY